MCFSMAWIEQILVWLVIVCAVFAILRLLVPFVLGQLGIAGGLIAQVINIVIWAFITIMVIYICFALISCLMGGVHLPALR